MRWKDTRWERRSLFVCLKEEHAILNTFYYNYYLIKSLLCILCEIWGDGVETCFYVLLER